MAETLKDPSKPAGYVFPEDVNEEDGTATTNDGRKLKSARANKWYVLATIYGQHEAGVWPWNWDKDTVAKNRRAWNGWACAELSEERRAELAREMELDPADLKPLSAAENADILKRFRKRMEGKTVELPSQKETIDFRETYFENPLGFEKYVVSGLADFVSATFSGHAVFGSATFSGPAVFGSATFSGLAVFRSATFSGDADFRSATFSGPADFGSATFSGHAVFGSATFSGHAVFGSATFSGPAYFLSAKFKSTTSFRKAIFETHVPAFFGADLYADTTFEIPGTAMQQRLHWPPFTGDPNKIMPAEDQKRAYNRLRLFMNQSLQTEDEQFFHRREMECKKQIALQDGGEGRFMFCVYWFYWLLSDYGHSVGRPLAWLGGAVTSGWVLFMLHLYSTQGPLTAEPIWKALGISFGNVFLIFGFRSHFLLEFYENLPAHMVFLSGAQTVLGFILLFLLGLGLRSRFRLR